MAFDLTYLVFIPFVIAISLKIYISNKVKIQDSVKIDFEKLGYVLISERPYKFSEMKFTVRFSNITINNIPANQYGPIKEVKRVFIAKHEDGNIYQLFTTILKDNSKIYEI